MTWTRAEDRFLYHRTVDLPDPLPCNQDRCVGMLVKAMLAGDDEQVADIMAHDAWHKDVVWGRQADRLPVGVEPERTRRGRLDQGDSRLGRDQDRPGIAEVPDQPMLAASGFGQVVENLVDVPRAELHGVPVDAQPHGRTSILVRLLRTVARRASGGER